MSKFGNVPVTVDGIRFASRLEAKRYGQLAMLHRSGLISGLVCQPTYELLAAFTDSGGTRHRRLTYVGDFFYYDDKDIAVVEDVKGGVLTEAFRIKEKLFRSKYPGIKFVIVKENG